MRTLSYSQLDVFTNCERRWYYERIARLPQPPAPQLEIGNLYHLALEQMIRVQMAGRPLSWIPWQAEVTRVAAMAGEGPSELCAEITRNLERIGALVLPHLAPVGVEHRFSSPGLSGKIDLVSDKTPRTDSFGNIIGTDDRRCVLDWKVKFSDRNRRTQQSADDSDQLGLYALEAGVDIAGFVEIPRNLQRPIRTFTTEFDAADKARLRRYFDAQFAAMRTRGPDEAAYRLSVRNNPLCSARWCPFHRHCPGGKGEK